MDKERVLKEIDAVLTDVMSVSERFPYIEDPFNNIQFDPKQKAEVTRANMQIDSIINRLAPPWSTYIEKASQQLSKRGGVLSEYNLVTLIGVLQSLRNDYSRGGLSNVISLVSGDLFSSFIDMSEHLLDEGYKDAATVICGGALEEHLRQLAVKAEVPLSVPNGDRKTIHILNDDLRKKGVYEGAHHKAIIAWAALRNHAAHAEYDKYSAAQVANMISGVRTFTLQNPL